MPVGDTLSLKYYLDFDARGIGKIDEIIFHPDKTGRVILKTDESVDCYKIISGNDSSTISTQYTFELSPSNSGIAVEKSSIRVLSFAYNSELNIFGILIQRNKNRRPIFYNNTGIVNIYDNSNGELLRSVKLKKVKISDINHYTLFINSYSIIVCEWGFDVRDQFIYTVHVYMM